jgi:hypothetical protein
LLFISGISMNTECSTCSQEEWKNIPIIKWKNE